LENRRKVKDLRKLVMFEGLMVAGSKIKCMGRELLICQMENRFKSSSIKGNG